MSHAPLLDDCEADGLEKETSTGLSARDPQKKRIGEILKFLREKRGLSQDRLAAKINLIAGSSYQRTMVSKYENGENTPSLDYINAASIAFEIHTLTVWMCVQRSDPKYWDALANLNAAGVVDDGIFDLFTAFGDKLTMIERSDIDIAFKMLSTAITAKVDALAGE